jgi:hypothetical protein
MLIQWRNWKLIWVTPIIFGLVGGIEALIAGSVVGGVYVEMPFVDRFWECPELIRLLQYRRCLHRRLLWHVDMDTLLVGHHQCSCPDLVFLCDPRRLVNGLTRGGEARLAGVAGLAVHYPSIASGITHLRTRRMSWIGIEVSKQKTRISLTKLLLEKNQTALFLLKRISKLELRFIALGIILQDQGNNHIRTKSQVQPPPSAQHPNKKASSTSCRWLHSRRARRTPGNPPCPTSPHR